MTDPAAPVDPDALLDGLTDSQRSAVTTDSHPLCVLASAGAGKTRVLTRRIAYRVATGSATGRHVLALTFTRKAAAELSGRLAGLGLGTAPVAGTFHSVASAQLRQWWGDRRIPPPTLLTSKTRLLAQLAAERRALAGVPPSELATQIEWAKARLVDPDEAAHVFSGRSLPAPAQEVAALYRRYQHELVRRRLVDFDDLLARCADAMTEDPAFAAAQRWRWRHVFVDEYQDLNPLQHRLLRTWLGERTDLCVVGDPHQAIYGWNGADPRLLHDFGQHWPGACVLHLDDNHRCSPQVVAAGRAVLGAGARALRSSQPDGPAPSVSAFRSDEVEARGVVGQMQAAHGRGTAWAEMAVLVRTNAQIPVLRTALRTAGVPHRVAGAQRLLDQPRVRQAMDDLRARKRLPFDLLLADLEAAGSEDPGAGADDGLAFLASLGREYARLDAEPTATGFLTWLPCAAADDGAGGEGVTVATFHRAKGLEWPAVWLCGLEKGLVPLTRGSEPVSDEERRLLYVAVTRAGRHLHCSWAETRSFGGRPVPREPSPWLQAIAGSAGGRGPDPAGPDEWRRRLADQRRALRSGSRQGGTPPRRRAAPGNAGTAGSTTDPALVSRLRAWRSERARASGVPPYVLLHDTTLEALAALRPADHDQLLSVPGIGPVKAARFGDQLLELVGGSRASA